MPGHAVIVPLEASAMGEFRECRVFPLTPGLGSANVRDTIDTAQTARITDDGALLRFIA